MLEDRRTAAREAASAFLISRLLVAAVAVFAALKLNPAASGEERIYDVPRVTHPFGGWPLEELFDRIFSPLARWDAVHFLRIAGEGYGAAPGDPPAAFFPLYPLLVHLVSGLGSSRAAVLIASQVVSLAAFAGALYLLHRLVELELGRPLARPVLLLTALFPTAFFFSAPYSESVFLLVSVGAFYAARTGRWAWAGALAAAASATRVQGLALLVPLVVLYLYGPRSDARAESEPARSWAPRHRLRPSILWLALAPLGVVLFSVHLGAVADDALAWIHVQSRGFSRDLGLPFRALWDGFRAAGAGAIDLVTGTGDARAAAINLTDFAFLGFAAVATWGALRRLPPAYGLYALAALALPLSTPFPPEPLASLPRYALTIFPLVMWTALVARERGVFDRVLAVSAVLLGVFTTQHATWQWVA